MSDVIDLFTPGRTRQSHRYDRHLRKYVKRLPYYFDQQNLQLRPHPWHCMFSNFSLYRWIIGGNWIFHIISWVRLEDCRDDEFCHDHAQMEPCPDCKTLSEAYDI